MWLPSPPFGIPVPGPNPKDWEPDTTPPVFAGTAFVLSYPEDHLSSDPLFNVSSLVYDYKGVTHFKLSDIPLDDDGLPCYYVNDDGIGGLTPAGATAQTNDYEWGLNDWWMQLGAIDAAGNETWVPLNMRVLDVENEEPHEHQAVLVPDLGDANVELFY